MPRIAIEERKSYPFSVDLEVRVTDLNYGGHLGYDRLLGLLHHARLAFFANLGATELNLGDGLTGIVAVDVAVLYQGEAFANDVLMIEIRPVEVGRGSFRLAHRVRRKDGRKVALAEIGFSAYDYRARRPVALPASFRDELERLDEDRP